jgi:23S rRNA (adenine2503-C2)-methyltransferase
VANAFDLSGDDWAEWVGSIEEPSYRADQIWHALYVDQVTDFETITTLPLSIRRLLAEEFNFGQLRQRRRLTSEDGTTQKLLYELEGSGRYIEAVLMRYDDRRTACISTQSGCAMGCVFCATGQMGFQRNLTSGEIIEQVIDISLQLKRESDRLTNVVVMGMGEPFHNYDATLTAMTRLGDEAGMNFGARRITISTVGLVPAIRRYTEEGHTYNLAVSLHAATDDLRSSMLPINDRYPLADLMSACREYVRRSRRRLTFEWALVDGVNDSTVQAELLADLVAGMLCHVNLIPLNPTRGYRGDPAQRRSVDAFRARLANRGISNTVRVRRGLDIDAGCGQLAVKAESAAGKG